jgi:hypothetical protein
MNIENFKKRLKTILKKDESVVVSINGKWGVGKTYFWDKFKNDLTDKKTKTVYVSLFGKETIANIRTNICLQVITEGKGAKVVDGARKLFESIKVPFVDISTLITLLDNQDFKDVIVCFDDFERLSKSLHLKEVLGFISELKEQKQCKIVMIFNKEKLGKKDSSTLSKFKEKIIDYEFNYDPIPSESLAILQDKLIAFKDYPLLKYLEKHKENNIRIISRIINALNDFSFIQPHIKNEQGVTTEIVGSIIEIAAINARTSSFDGLIKYAGDRKRLEWLSSKSDKSDKFKENKKYEGLLSLIEGDDFSKPSFLQSNVVSILLKYFRTSFVDEKSLIKIIKLKVNNQRLYFVRADIEANWEKHLYDMSHEIDTYVSDLWQILQDEKDEIIIAGDTYFNPANFIYDVEQLEELDIENKEKYHDFAIERLKSFIKNNIHLIQGQNVNFEEPKELLDFDGQLSNYYEQCIEENQQESVNSVEQIIDLMNKIIKNSSWGDEPKILSQVRLKDIERYILDSPKYVKKTVRFLYHYGRTEQFSTYVGNVVSIFRKLSESNNKNHAHKAQKILENLEKEHKIELLSSDDISK